MIKKIARLLGYVPESDLNKALAKVDSWEKCRSQIYELARAAGILAPEDGECIRHTPNAVLLLGGNGILVDRCHLEIRDVGIVVLPSATGCAITNITFTAAK